MVQPKDVVFKPFQHKFLLKFFDGTTVGDRNKHLILDKVVEVTPFCDIISEKWKRDGLIDWWQKTAGQHCLERLGFIKYNQSKTDASFSTVVFLQYAKVKEEGQNFPLSVSNTYNVTKLYINDDLKAIKDFMNICQHWQADCIQVQLVISSMPSVP
ncbi:unnamed protein product [Vicia faba]|uniref:Uncharacterized protein n=1 Tax=Vicia faba TaxID=3906 RepID=A0AAV0YH04_VICFA|nr:unnamed protein product [Vicia faba]